MPREVVHWLVVEEAGNLLPARRAARVHECLQRQKAAAYLGAVIHDAPYYYRFGGKSFEVVAEWLHGRNGEDTFIPLRDVAEEIRRSAFTPAEREPLWALLLGMVSHMVADTVFHPMVFYFSGDYYDPRREQCEAARARHRLIEVYLDSWFYAKYPLWNERSIGRVVSGFREASRAYTVLDAVLGADTAGLRYSRPVAGAWGNGVWYQALIQRLCLSPAAGALVSGLDRLSGGKLSAIEALSSYGRNKPEALFEKALDFRNPITGEHTLARVDELLHVAAAEFAALCERFEPLLAASASPAADVLAGIQGKSLSYGILGGRPEDASHYAHRGLALRGMEF